VADADFQLRGGGFGSSSLSLLISSLFFYLFISYFSFDLNGDFGSRGARAPL